MVVIKLTVISVDVFTKYVHTVTSSILSVFTVSSKESVKKVKYQKYYIQEVSKNYTIVSLKY